MSMEHSNLLPRVREAFEFAQGQVRRLVESRPGYYPMYTVAGKWGQEGERWTHWCDGFLPGIMWLFHQRTGDVGWRAKAEEYSRPLEPRQHDREVHDLGFIFMSTYYRWLQVTGDPALRAVLIQAGRTMGLRFKERGQYLRSFVADESLFIDIMMNVGIIFYAARETGDAALEAIARRHCLTSRRVLVRGDGSTAHEGLFDLQTGEFIRQSTHQGYRGDSCWSRGLAWALYGFGTAYSYTGDQRFLETACLCADFYLEQTPSGVPPWDYDAPTASRAQPDSSAAAIAASGLWDLGELAATRSARRLYRQAATRIVGALTMPDYLASGTPGWEGILKRGVYHIHKGLGVDESVAWGEHFFVEALVKVLGGLEAAADDVMM
jgi:unsaturated chondroitin disaccharide hydrolase